MLRLKVLGSLDLRREDGGEVRPVLAQPKRVALLAYLALARPGHFLRRDSVAALLWPGADQGHARGSLRQSLYFLRRGLEGEDVLETRGEEEVRLRSATCWCDAVAFDEAVGAGDWTAALELYQGDLLEGFFVRDCPDFEKWLDEERQRRREAAAGAAWARAHELIGAGELVEAERTAQRALSLVYTDESEVHRFIQALAEAGARAAALGFYRKFERVLAEGLEVEPSPETRTMAERLLSPTSPTPVGEVETRKATRPTALPRVSSFDSAPPPPPRAGRERWLAAPRLLATAAFLVAVAVGTSRLHRREDATASAPDGSDLASILGAEPSLAVSPTRVAVFPPTVVGADSARAYSEWVSDIVYRLIDGLGGLEGVDPNLLYSDVERSGAGDVGIHEGRSLARHVGAGMFVLTRLSDIGGRLSLSSTLYHTDEVEAPAQQAFAEGAWDEIGSLAEELTRGLLTGYLVERDDRLLGTAQLPRVGFAALRPYLEGEQLFRQRSFGAAMRAFDRAIAADSSFSLAWFGRAMLRGQWQHSASSVEAALTHASGLTVRDSLLLEAVSSYYGDAERGDELTRDFMARFPGFTLGYYVRANLLIWSNWKWGRSMSEAREPLTRLLALEPDHPLGLFFLYWVAGFEDHVQEADSLLTVYLRGKPDAYWQAYLEAERALDGAEGARRDSVLLAISAFPRAVLEGLSLDNWRRADAARLLIHAPRQPKATRLVGLLILAHAEAGRGRWQAASRFLDEMGDADPGLATAYRGLLASMPYLDLPDSTLRRIRNEVAAWDGSYLTDLDMALEGSSTIRLWEVPALLGQHVRTYVLGLLAGRLGDVDEIQGRARTLLASVGSTACSHLGSDLAAELRALAALSEGDADAALALLEGVELDVCNPVEYNIPLNMRPFGRFLRADLLARSGREAEALGWFSGFAPLWGTEELLYQPFLYLRRAQLEEGLGQPNRAREHYLSFIEAWKQADPHLQHHVSFARERLAALRAEDGGGHAAEGSRRLR